MTWEENLCGSRSTQVGRPSLKGFTTLHYLPACCVLYTSCPPQCGSKGEPPSLCSQKGRCSGKEAHLLSTFPAAEALDGFLMRQTADIVLLCNYVTQLVYYGTVLLPAAT